MGRELLDLFNIPASLLACGARIERQGGRNRREPVPGPYSHHGIAVTSKTALFRPARIVPGMVKNTYGTGCFMLMHTGERPVSSRAQAVDDCSMPDRPGPRVRPRRQRFVRVQWYSGS